MELQHYDWGILDFVLAIYLHYMYEFLRISPNYMCICKCLYCMIDYDIKSQLIVFFFHTTTIPWVIAWFSSRTLLVHRYTHPQARSSCYSVEPNLLPLPPDPVSDHVRIPSPGTFS
jgi:hypothetical protein